MECGSYTAAVHTLFGMSFMRQLHCRTPYRCTAGKLPHSIPHFGMSFMRQLHCRTPYARLECHCNASQCTLPFMECGRHTATLWNVILAAVTLPQSIRSLGMSSQCIAMHLAVYGVRQSHCCTPYPCASGKLLHSIQLHHASANHSAIASRIAARGARAMACSRQW